MTPLRLLLVDGHEISRRGLRAFLAADARCAVVGEARNATSAVAAAAGLRPDVVVLELRDSGFSVVEWMERLRALDAAIRLVILTDHDEPGVVRSALDAGVASYVLKRSSESVLRHVIDALLSMRVYVDPALATPDFSHHPMASIGLSQREQEVVTQVALGRTSKEIACEMHVSSKTVETYRSRASQKLGLVNRSDWVRYALDRGWMTASVSVPPVYRSGRSHQSQPVA